SSPQFEGAFGQTRKSPGALMLGLKLGGGITTRKDHSIVSSDLQSQNVSTGQYLNLTRIPGMTIVVARVREASAHRRLITPDAVVAARSEAAGLVQIAFD